MRFLHISDLHIGKRMHNVDITEDQKYVLSQIPDMVRKYSCDAVLIAGDIYDRSQPSERAIRLVDSLLRDLSETGKPVYMVSGNHDNPAQISYLSELLEKSDIFVSDRLTEKPQVQKMTDEFGEINIYLVPFIRPSMINAIFPEANVSSYEEAFKVLLDSYDIDMNSRNVLIAHQFIKGASMGGSEEMSIGTLEDISAEVVSDFDYCALGHIHAPQKVGSDRVRYCGSIMKYHFDEYRQKKAALLVDLKEKGNISVEEIPFSFLRDVRRLEGKFDELMRMPRSDDYIEAILTDDNLLMDARSSLSEIFPNLLSIKFRSRVYGEYAAEAKVYEEDMGLLDHFDAFYKQQHGGEEPSENMMEIMKKTITKMEEENETAIS